MLQASGAQRKGEEAERNGCHDDAIFHYKQAVGYYMNVSSTTRDEHQKCAIIETAVLITERLKQLEGDPSTRPTHKKTTANVNGRHREYGCGGGGGGGENEASERDDMRKQILSLKTKPEDLGVAIGWNEVIGMESTKNLLKRTVEDSITIGHIMVGMRQPPTGILLYGPPGVGKTYIVQALAKECKRSFFNVPSHVLRSKYLGDSGKMIAAMFSVIRENKPAILFIDEIEALCGSRDSTQQHGESSKALTVLLTELDGFGTDNMKDILLIGGTNLPHAIDDAMRRRFNRKIYIGLPSQEDRFKLLKHVLSKNANDYGDPIPDHLLEEVAKKTDLFSHSDMVNLIKAAYYYNGEALHEATHFRPVLNTREDPPKWCIVPCEAGDKGATAISFSKIKDTSTVRATALTYQEIVQSLEVIKPGMTHEKLKVFEEWTQQYGQTQ